MKTILAFMSLDSVVEYLGEELKPNSKKEAHI